MIFSITMGADYPFEVKKTIEIWVPTSFKHDNLAVATMILLLQQIWERTNKQTNRGHAGLTYGGTTDILQSRATAAVRLTLGSAGCQYATQPSLPAQKIESQPYHNGIKSFSKSQ